MNGLMEGSGYDSVNEVLHALLSKDGLAEAEAFREAGKSAAERRPLLSTATNLAGTAAKWWLLSRLFGTGMEAFGLTGPAASAAKTGLTFSAAQAIDSAGDLAAGRSDWGEFFKDVEQAGKMGLTTDVLMTALGSILNALSMRNAPNGQLPLVPVQSTNRSLVPAGGQSGLPELPDIVQGTGMTNSELLGLAEAIRKGEEEKLLDEAFERGFDEEFQEPIDPYEKVRYNQDGTIIVTDDLTKQGHQSIPKHYKPNAVVDVTSRGVQHDRIIYDEHGRFKTFIHGSDHARPKYHPYGTHGEHAHDFVWIPGEQHPHEITRELTELERIQHADIIGRK